MLWFYFAATTTAWWISRWISGSGNNVIESKMYFSGCSSFTFLCSWLSSFINRQHLGGITRFLIKICDSVGAECSYWCGKNSIWCLFWRCYTNSPSKWWSQWNAGSLLCLTLSLSLSVTDTHRGLSSMSYHISKEYKWLKIIVINLVRMLRNV